MGWTMQTLRGSVVFSLAPTEEQWEQGGQLSLYWDGASTWVTDAVHIQKQELAENYKHSNPGL